MAQPHAKPRFIDLTYRLVFAGGLLGLAGLGFVLFGLLLLLALSQRLGVNYRADLAALSELQGRLPTLLLTAGIIQMTVVGLVVFVFSLLWSHAISGPLVRVRRFLRLIAGGQDVEELRFRHTDQLHGLAEAFQRFILARRSRHEAWESCLARAQQLIQESERVAAPLPGEPAALSERREALQRVYEQMRELLGRTHSQ